MRYTQKVTHFHNNVTRREAFYSQLRIFSARIAVVTRKAEVVKEFL